MNKNNNKNYYVESGSENKELESKDFLELLIRDALKSSLVKGRCVSYVDRKETDNGLPGEYVLPASALTERKTLEELGDMATGAYKFDAPADEAPEMFEDYFEHTLKLRALSVG